MRGATRMLICFVVITSNFNPRTPCEVRLLTVLVLLLRLKISIHAPHARCDNDSKRHPLYCNYFNPRTPCEVRRQGANVNKMKTNFNPRTPCEVRRFFLLRIYNRHKFQSTHPMRGATHTGHYNREDIGISIHAPHARCDFTFS